MPETKTTALHPHFDDLEQQEASAQMGMWLFLVTEIMLFGGLFLGYAVYRWLHPEAWAEASHHNNLLLGTINTAVLLVSSLTMALAVHAAEEEAWDTTTTFMGATLALGVLFVGVKFYEYYEHIHHGLLPGPGFAPEGVGAELVPFVEMFMLFYFVMTGLHATHMLIGFGLLGVTMWRCRTGRMPYYMPVETVGLYWHLVDIVWVFLFPMLYLVG